MVKEALCNWILHHPQVVQSPIVNDCLYVPIDGNYGEKLPPELLLQVSVQETNNIMMSPP